MNCYKLLFVYCDGSSLEVPFKSTRVQAFRLFDMMCIALYHSPFHYVDLLTWRCSKFIGIGHFVAAADCPKDVK